VNYTDLGIQLTRSFRALKVWLSFKMFGVAAFRESIPRGFRMAELADQRLHDAMPDWEIRRTARMAVVCFRYRRGDDTLHARLVEAMLEDGFALCTSRRGEATPSSACAPSTRARRNRTFLTLWPASTCS